MATTVGLASFFLDALIGRPKWSTALGAVGAIFAPGRRPPTSTVVANCDIGWLGYGHIHAQAHEGSARLAVQSFDVRVFVQGLSKKFDLSRQTRYIWNQDLVLCGPDMYANMSI